MNKIEVANGYVELISYMSSEADICKIARISTGSDGTNDAQLINHLVKHGHNQVLEFGQMIFKVKCPIFVARQWQRYRTGSFNEMSGRYRKMNELPFISEKLSHESAEFMKDIHWQYSEEIDIYGTLMQDARQILPLATMTEFYWRTDCNNIMNFLKQRLHKSAQAEIREYAWALRQMVARIYPNLMEAFENNIRRGINLDLHEQGELCDLLKANNIEIPKFLE